MKSLLRFALVALFVATLLSGHGIVSVSAQELQHLNTHRAWNTYTFRENGNLVCYMSSKPTREEGDYSQRGDVYFLVAHRPAEASRDVANIFTGYTYKSDSGVSVDIDGSEFEFFTRENTAWSRDPAMDGELIAAMKAGNNMVVKGTSSRGTLTTDTYSLLGFTAAYNQITRTCGF